MLGSEGGSSLGVKDVPLKGVLGMHNVRWMRREGGKRRIRGGDIEERKQV